MHTRAVPWPIPWHLLPSTKQSTLRACHRSCTHEHTRMCALYPNENALCRERARERGSLFVCAVINRTSIRSKSAAHARRADYIRNVQTQVSVYSTLDSDCTWRTNASATACFSSWAWCLPRCLVLQAYRAARLDVDRLTHCVHRSHACASCHKSQNLEFSHGSCTHRPLGRL